MAETFNSLMMETNYLNRKRFIIGVSLLFLFAGVMMAYFLLSSLRDNQFQRPILQNQSPDPVMSSIYPSGIIDLRNWKLTLPISNSGSKGESIDVKQPELTDYQMQPWFGVAPDKKGVVFRAAVNAPTTVNSNYPRSELREMTKDGKEEAFWPSTSGTHTLFIDEAITAVPKNKKHVVAGQIHGDDDDLLVIRLEHPKLYLSRSKSNLVTLDDNYELGKRFSIRFVANGGRISVYYNNSVAPVYTLEKEVNEAYFKAGVYTQSNCETEDSSSLCNDNNFGEVVIYQLNVTHA